MPLEVRILGPVEALKDGHSVRIARAKPRALLAFLALENGREVSRDRIIDALWGERELRDSRNVLQAQVAQLRRALETAGEPGLLVTRPGGYALAIDPEQVDLVRFEQLARLGREALAAGDADTASLSLTEALMLWRGEPLGGLGDEPFVERTAARLAEIRLAAVETRAEANLQLGRHSEVVPELTSLVAAEPYRELLWRQLAVALYRCGRQADALDVLRTARRALAEDLGLEPGLELRRLEREILEHGESLASPEPAPAGPQAPGIPVPTTRLIGRGAELRLLRSLLERAETRIVTLTGPGGIGKTRLALAFAHDVAAQFRDGSAFVDLSAVAEPSPDRISRAVAEQLGIAEEPGRPPIETLQERLRRRQQLIVLDNFEHVIAAAPTIGELSAACPQVRLVLTSRQPLRIGGEREVPVPPLDLPESDDPDALAQSSAGALVLECARAVGSTFDLRTEDAAALAEVCRRVDGLPLALELAATRLRILTARELAERIGRPLAVLAGGARDAAPRHRTLRATLEWSHRLLTADEKRAFASLAVFPADFSPQAAEAVCRAGQADPLDLVASLVEQSLVQRMHANGSRTRLRLLETVREFAVERLIASRREDEIRLRHATYFSVLADEAGRALAGPERVEWLDRLDLERENLRAALEAHLSSGRADEALRIVAALWQWWFVRGAWPEGQRWIDRSLELAADASLAARAAALNAGGILALLCCDYPRARALLERGLAASTEIDDDRGRASALRALAGVERETGGYERALAYQRDGLAIWRELGDAPNISGSLSGLAMTKLLQGELDDARTLSEESLELAERVGASEDAARALHDLAFINHFAGDDEHATEFAHRALALALEINYAEAISWAQHALGLIALRAADHRTAAVALRQALESSRTLGDRWSTARYLEALAAVAAAVDAHERSALLIGAADGMRAVIGAPISPLETPAHDQVLAVLRTSLGPRIGELLDRGRRLTPSEVDGLADATAQER